MIDLGAENVQCVGDPTEPNVSNENRVSRHREGLIQSIQLNKDGLTCESDLNVMAQLFSQQHTLRLPQLLHPDSMRMILEHMEHGDWMPYNHGEIGAELLLDSAGTLAVLRFLVNTPEFLRMIQSITQCRVISVFDGRVYRMAPGTGHHDSWHSDACDRRLVGMSVNLGSRPYSGGVFQLRKKSGEEMLCEIPNVVQGDAILFRISPELEHRITPMAGTEPKTAFAGWFRSGATDLFSQIRQLASHPHTAPEIG